MSVSTIANPGRQDEDPAALGSDVWRLCWIQHPQTLSAVIVLALLTFAAGCGNSDKPPTATDASQPQAQQAGDANRQEGQAAAEPIAQKPRAKAPVAATTTPAIDPSTNPNDVFETVPGERTFERVNNADGPVSANSFTAYFPMKGAGSTKFKTLARLDGPPRQTDKPPASANAKQPKGDEASSEDAAEKKKLPSGFRAIERWGYSHVGWPKRIVCTADGAEMALVTGGAVTVGHDGEPAESSPQLSVVLDSFYMDVSEVTLQRFEHFRQNMNAEKGPRAVPEPPNAKSPPDFPVLGVTLKQAQFFARWAGKELPTEAEWERAARGESAFAHPWGNGRAIWSRARRRDTMTAVKSFPTDVSPYGIYDLAGNAREWCADRYSPTAFANAKKLSRTPLRNWKGPQVADPPEFHVVKGNGPHWDAWYREGLDSTGHHRQVGFRCVLRLNSKN